ncbi:hypothetical protein C7U92_18055 [Bradyrhizobium sp. WBOS7]|uniref:Uncharacterized protein n=1 Tax=Bradyrhizobium betae TaxID=244734 RepID=A0AAE9N852_9BRAD|nr:MULTISPECIES: hypothetical protein [Bradyrhizobium]MDD1572697.1 hypothetical protein [Bradyrhizobium sp. WBOS1]UUO33547.1 hypothetical protein DCK84_02435 [Bradyrhizobium sp. WBOS01]MDD1528036.1 hypothetical protein [Bradyrhizobium sp. WBOS2]MDD1578616.1 hypothetical protein [Bradyrhizobium sp. WBOS7]MDD1603178.1 hypothetical protein [Bradyrhizobium sp. WBOS16]
MNDLDLSTSLVLLVAFGGCVLLFREVYEQGNGMTDGMYFGAAAALAFLVVWISGAFSAGPYSALEPVIPGSHFGRLGLASRWSLLAA